MAAASAGHGFWTVFGTLGALIFYGRFYVQWIASEIRKKSVIPIVFWYMSSAGSLMLLVFAVVTQSPLGALGQTLNTGIYARNLIHIWRGQGRLTQLRYTLVHVSIAAVLLASCSLLIYTWHREVAITREAPAHEAARVWLWLAVGVLGQVFFAARFLVQWLATELKRKSVVPPVFWWLSVIASLLQLLAFAQRREWVFACGMAATLLIYLRNLWFIHGTPGAAQAQEEGAS